MIRVNRGAEPAALVRARANHLATAIAAFNNEEGLEFLGYSKAAKRTLYDAQHEKCAYCERQPGYDQQPVEHFRPKGGAIRSLRDEEPVVRDPGYYWWLAWTWENLLFACATCNSQARKGNYFPLVAQGLQKPSRPATDPLPQACFNLSDEQALLLDPSVVDPLDHLRWRPVDREVPVEFWDWGLGHRTEAGRVTIFVLKLDDRADAVVRRYRETVWPRFRDGVVNAGNGALARLGWAQLVADLIRPESELTAATWWMLNTLRRSTPQLRELALPEPPRP